MKPLPHWLAVLGVCALGGLVCFGVQRIEFFSSADRTPDMSYVEQIKLRTAEGNLLALQHMATTLGGSISGTPGALVFVDVPGSVWPFEARRLADTIRQKVGGVVKVRDGSGLVLATADAFGVHPGP